jgi:hypothetical protein
MTRRTILRPGVLTDRDQERDPTLGLAPTLALDHPGDFDG